MCFFALDEQQSTIQLNHRLGSDYLALLYVQQEKVVSPFQRRMQCSLVGRLFAGSLIESWWGKPSRNIFCSLEKNVDERSCPQHPPPSQGVLGGRHKGLPRVFPRLFTLSPPGVASLYRFDNFLYN
eukprot:TRINITY_DN2546_c0_g1_i2.p2 TRINITY_DN2546_c0_g1~~TRINITY_DN2546_c0_g1_i2.p2  ORF type:complete len:126 (+),score=4.52 TRINITY_DN2546_c0_g1_i2:1777-2154(+)